MLADAVQRRRRPSKQMITLLGALSRQPQEWRYGYDLIKETGLLSGTLYPLLMRMSDQALVEAKWSEATQPGRPPRHMYRLTGAGLALAQTMERQAATGSAAVSFA